MDRDKEYKYARERFRQKLAIIIIVGFLVVLIALLVVGNYEQAVTAMVGGLAGYVATIYQYEYGSSRGSAEKTEIMNENLNQ
jgi:1,4-dihydroxy-2-naphthoate octaprenyltransferase